MSANQVRQKGFLSVKADLARHKSYLAVSLYNSSECINWCANTAPRKDSLFFSLFTFYICFWTPGLAEPDTFDTSSKAELSHLASCIQALCGGNCSSTRLSSQSTRKADRWAAASSVLLSLICLSSSAVRPVNITVSLFSAASPELTAVHSNPPSWLSLSEGSPGRSTAHSKRSTRKLKSCAKRVLNRRYSSCAFSSLFVKEDIWQIKTHL